MTSASSMLYPAVAEGIFDEGKLRRTKRRRRRSDKRIVACIAILFVLFVLIIPDLCNLCVAYAADGPSEEELKEQLGDALNDAIDGLDLSQLEQYINSLSKSEAQVINIHDVKAALKALVSGGGEDFFERLLKVLSTTVGVYFAGFVPAFVSVLTICLLCSMLGALTGDFLNKSTTQVVHTVCYIAVVLVLMTGVASVVRTTVGTVDALGRLAAAIFPVLLTLISMLGGAASAALYTPMMAVLSGFIMQIITTFIVPAFIATIVFSVVGNVTGNVKLDKLTSLIKSASGWLIGIVFGLFATYLAVKGITGGVVDRFSFNLAKFALSSYVPILGGYLSDGFDLMSASIVLVKNALGFTGATLLIAAVAFPLVRVVIFTLTLRLTAAVAEPIGDSRVAGLMTNVAGAMNLLITALMGAAFLFYIIVLLLIGSLNV